MQLRTLPRKQRQSSGLDGEADWWLWESGMLASMETSFVTVESHTRDFFVNHAAIGSRHHKGHVITTTYI